jgi:hypothetical protein
MKSISERFPAFFRELNQRSYTFFLYLKDVEINSESLVLVERHFKENSLLNDGANQRSAIILGGGEESQSYRSHNSRPQKRNPKPHFFPMASRHRGYGTINLHKPAVCISLVADNSTV